VVRLSRRVVRLRAPNPSPMTLDGTNTYLVDVGGATVVIDPGPVHAAHQAATVAAAGAFGTGIAAIVVTHGHPDHAPGAVPLAEHLRVPVYAHPLAEFPYDVAVRDGAAIGAGDAALQVVEAPGHARDHIVLYLADERALFTGDVVVGRGTVVVAPPGGDMRAYQATLGRLRLEFAAARAIFGGHGERVDDPAGKLDEYIAHRIARERALVAVLEREGSRTIPQLVRTLYVDTSPALWPAAARQVLAYLEALQREGVVCSEELARAPSAEEARLLHPDLSHLGDPEAARVIVDELGLRAAGEPIRAYALAPTQSRG
jgi:glyoxylase-like metal-dependent hydrolase (beta-lactamase superfamily II)